jgi:hypothetical protein
VSHRGAARTLMLLLRSTYLEGPFANEVVRRAVRSIHTHGDRTHGDRAGRHLPTCREPRRSTKQPDSAGRVEVKHRLPPNITGGTRWGDTRRCWPRAVASTEHGSGGLDGTVGCARRGRVAAQTAQQARRRAVQRHVTIQTMHRPLIFLLMHGEGGGHL